VYLKSINTFLSILLLIAGTSIRCMAASKVEAFFVNALSAQGWKLEGEPYHYTPQSLYKLTRQGRIMAGVYDLAVAQAGKTLLKDILLNLRDWK